MPAHSIPAWERPRVVTETELKACSPLERGETPLTLEGLGATVLRLPGLRRAQKEEVGGQLAADAQPERAASHYYHSQPCHAMPATLQPGSRSQSRLRQFRESPPPGHAASRRDFFSVVVVGSGAGVVLLPVTSHNAVTI